MKFSAVLYIMGVSSVVSANPQKDEDKPKPPTFPSFSRVPGQGPTAGPSIPFPTGGPPTPPRPTGGLPPRPSGSAPPRPSFTPLPRPSSFTISVRPTRTPVPLPSGRPTAVPRPSRTRSIGLAPRPTPVNDEAQ